MSLSAVTGQRSANRKSDFLVNKLPQTGPRSPPKNICIASNLSKALAQPLALTFPDTSLFIKVIKSLERKIDERLRSSTSRIAVNGLGFNEMQLLASFAECVLPPTIEGFVTVEEGLTIAPNSLKTWWPGTESNRRRQPFQGYVMLYFKQLK